MYGKSLYLDYVCVLAHIVHVRVLERELNEKPSAGWQKDHIWLP